MNNFYQLKVTLTETTPAVWRRFVVPASITLDRLHDVLQIVMGWEDSHLHDFIFKKKIYTELPESSTDEYEAVTRLNELLKKKGNTLIYRYDFGDDWLHEITLEDKNYFPDEMLCPFECIEGEMICPMEDCGGPGSYTHMLEIINNPHNNKEGFEELLEIIGVPDADPKELEELVCSFDIDEVNSALALYSRWSRDRELPLIDDY
ncbi:MAG TPA: plasmid pRiA4b ORF-3 family protein [Klebsiella sp.]